MKIEEGFDHPRALAYRTDPLFAQQISPGVNGLLITAVSPSDVIQPGRPQQHSRRCKHGQSQADRMRGGPSALLNFVEFKAGCDSRIVPINVAQKILEGQRLLLAVILYIQPSLLYKLPVADST